MGATTETTFLKIRASQAAKLMGKLEGITEKQSETLKLYQSRKDGNGKPLSKLQLIELEKLITKRDALPELPQTAKSYIEELWLKERYGYQAPLVTDVLLKGNICEQDAIGLVSRVYPCPEFRTKCKRYFEDDYFTGNPDVLLKKIIEDIKNAWSIHTFFNTTELDPIYYGQGQVYMHLAGRTKFRVYHCLVNTPLELVHAEQKKYYWKFGGDEDNPHYKEAARQIERNHNFDHIPESDRVKLFEFDYDPSYISELKKRVEMGRQYFDTLKLV
jgi:hypothetical protein